MPWPDRSTRPQSAKIAAILRLRGTWRSKMLSSEMPFGSPPGLSTMSLSGNCRIKTLYHKMVSSWQIPIFLQWQPYKNKIDLLSHIYGDWRSYFESVVPRFLDWLFVWKGSLIGARFSPKCKESQTDANHFGSYRFFGSKNGSKTGNRTTASNRLVIISHKRHTWQQKGAVS